MSGDEAFVTIAATVFSVAGWTIWVYRLVSVRRLRARRAPMAGLYVGLLVSIAIVVSVLLRASASDVRASTLYLTMYGMIGLAWLRLAELTFAWGGLSVRDDVDERANVAVVPAIVGAWIGVACCYGGGNVGEGPGWGVVVFSALLATAGLAVVWIAFSRMTTAIDVITIDRDTAAGFRFGGLLAACGLILGRAVAGNWVSVEATVADFVVIALAVLPIFGIAILGERAFRPTPTRPKAPILVGGAIPAALYVLVALLLVLWFGLPT